MSNISVKMVRQQPDLEKKVEAVVKLGHSNFTMPEIFELSKEMLDGGMKRFSYNKPKTEVFTEFISQLYIKMGKEMPHNEDECLDSGDEYVDIKIDVQINKRLLAQVVQNALPYETVVKGQHKWVSGVYMSDETIAALDLLPQDRTTWYRDAIRNEMPLTIGDRNGLCYTLTMKKMVDGYRHYLHDALSRSKSARFVRGDIVNLVDIIDPDVAGLVVQYAIFGKIMY